MESAGATYTEIRQWARWLQVFTARDLADSMHVALEIGERGVKALLWNKVCEDTGDWIDGPDGPERIVSYIPIPEGPRSRPRETPPEITAVREMGGDPLRVVRGLPIAMGDPARRSRVGQWHPGRRGPKTGAVVQR